MNTKFNSRETYKAYRSEWKAEYKELSQQIRDARFCRWFESLRKAERITPERIAHYNSLPQFHGQGNWCIHRLKKQATAMLEELAAAKVEAQRQYLAAHQKEMVMA